MPVGQLGGPTSDERDDALRDFAFALETICARIPPDETRLSGHESTAYQALVKWPEHVKSRHVRRLMGLEELTVGHSVSPQRITHGRHCTCSSCAREDWTNPDLASCGMHGEDCPALYQPWGRPGSHFDPALGRVVNGIRVTVEDLSGEQSTDSVVIEDDYVATTAGSCYVAHTQVFANGTHVLTIKGRKSCGPKCMVEPTYEIGGLMPWDPYYEHDEQADREHAFEVECTICGALYTNLDGDCPSCGSASHSYDSRDAERWNRYLSGSGR